MKEEFFFLLRYENLKKYSVRMRALHIMAALLLIFYAVTLIPAWNEKWMEIVVVIPVSVAIMIIVIFKKDWIENPGFNRIFRIVEMGFLSIASLYFLQYGNWWIALLFGFLGLFMIFLLMVEHKLFGEQFIRITRHGVEIPHLFHTSRIPWKQMDNIVLRYQYITFQLKNNLIIQKKIFHRYDEAELMAFTQFCKSALQT